MPTKPRVLVIPTNPTALKMPTNPEALETCPRGLETSARL
jgi:hypothetical protein